MFQNFKFLKEARKKNSKISRRDVQNFLATQRSYTLHRQATRRYRRLPTLAAGLHTEWQADLAMFDLPPSNVTNPYELSKNLYKLLGEGSEPLAEKVRTVQTAYAHSVGVASKWARQEYLGRKSREKRSVVVEVGGEDAALEQAIDTLTAFYGVDEEAGVEREKRAAPASRSRLPIKKASDSAESHQKKLDEHLMALKGADLELLDSLSRAKLAEEIAKMHEDDRAILSATQEVGMEAWIQAYRSVRFACQFVFNTLKNRFSLTLDPRYVAGVKISSQLSYILGFTATEFVNEKNEARFMPDMSGGVSSFHVYAPDLIEPMMIGDVTAPVLRIVTIRGKPDENVEEQFLAIHYHKLLVKELAELFIEIRTNSGSLMPFQYDQIPTGSIAKFPHCMVLNIDPSTSRGSHWVDASPELLVQFGGYNVFRGIPYQRGGGVGSVFRSLMRYLLPIGKQLGAAIGRQGLERGKKAQFLSRLDFDMGNQELYLLNNLDLLFTIYKAKDSFLLQTLLGNDTTKYRLAVHDVKLYAKMIEVQPTFNMSLYKSLEKQPATYACNSSASDDACNGWKCGVQRRLQADPV
uniref:Uncharacterized protein n=1 Tax=Globodera pallida TaxID=36090 RepID=A0A183C944_GLOPA